jgi:hypothetical protein
VARYARHRWQLVALLGNSLAKSRRFVCCNAIFRGFFMPGEIDAGQRNILAINFLRRTGKSTLLPLGQAIRVILALSRNMSQICDNSCVRVLVVRKDSGSRTMVWSGPPASCRCLSFRGGKAHNCIQSIGNLDSLNRTQTL